MDRQVRAFLDSLDSQLVYSPSTRLAYRNDMRCFVDYLQRTLQRELLLSDFNRAQISGFLEAERQAGRRPSTLLRRRATLRRFATYLREQCPEWVLESADEALQPDLPGDVAPAPSRSGAMTYEMPVQPHTLTLGQVEAINQVLERSTSPRARRDQAILSLLLENGLTVGTLISLNMEDLDLTAEKVRLHLNKNQELWLPLGLAVEPMQRYLKNGRPELNYRLDESALFISQTGGRMCRQGVWQVLRQWGHRARLPVTLSPRLARHTAAIRMAQTGRPLSEIQILLGHSNPLSTQALLRRLAAEGESAYEQVP